MSFDKELEKHQQSWIQQVLTQGALEFLSVSVCNAGQCWITIEGTGKPFIKKPFTQPQYCYEAALELEATFDILQVLEQRPPGTIERIEEMVEFYLERERALLAW